jgi:Flp pilus assembly pilin Flp
MGAAQESGYPMGRFSRRTGATSIEYAMLITLLAGAIISIIPGITSELNAAFGLLGGAVSPVTNGVASSVSGTAAVCNVDGRPGNPSASGLAHGTAADKCRPGRGQPGVYSQGGDPQAY